MERMRPLERIEMIGLIGGAVSKEKVMQKECSKREDEAEDTRRVCVT